MANIQSIPGDARGRRRQLIRSAIAFAASIVMLGACSPKAASFKSTDMTGVTFAKDLRLKDHMGNVRTMADFKGKIVVIFFGYTQCPDVCPTSMATMSEVKRLLGYKAEQLQVLFITVDPERDTRDLLQAYMQSFDPTFLALRPEPNELEALATDFKIFFKKVEGKTSTSYTMDHSAGKYIFDTDGRVRLFSQYGAEAAVIAADIKVLLGA